MWRQARRGASVHTWLEERQAIHDSTYDEELPSVNDEPYDYAMFDFNFKSVNRVFQRTLFEFHDKHRRDLNALWAGREQLESMSKQYEDWKQTKTTPRFLTKMRVPDKVAGHRCPADLDTRGCTFAEFVNELTDTDVNMKVEVLMRAKSAELDILRADASLATYQKRVTDCIDATFKELVEMDLQGDFRHDAWTNEARKFVDVSHEHLLFGKALAKTRQREATKKREEALTKAKSEFTQLPKELQLDLMIESKIANMMKGRGKGSAAVRHSLSEPALAHFCEARRNFTKEHGKFFGLSGKSGPNTPKGYTPKGYGKNFGNHSRQPSNRSVSTKGSRQQSPNFKGSKGKGKGKGKKGFIRNPSPKKGTNKGKGKGKPSQKGGGKSTSTRRQRSRSLTPLSQQRQWPPSRFQPSQRTSRWRNSSARRSNWQ